MPQKRFKSPQMRLTIKAWKNAKEAQKEAVEAEKTSKQAQTDAETALKNAEEANQATQAQIEETKADIVTKTQAVSDAKAHQIQAEQAVSTATQAVADAKLALAKAEDKVANKVTLAPEFIEAVKERYAYIQAVRNNEIAQSAEEIAARLKETKEKILRTQLGTPALNKFVPQATDLADTETYDVTNLPEDFKKDLVYFYAELLNQMRRQVGLPDVKVTEDSFHFADKIAKEYMKDKVTYDQLETYAHMQGGHGHYAIGINRVAKAYGLNDGQSEEKRKENEQRGSQSYENSVNFVNYRGSEGSVYKLTKSEIRNRVFDSMIDFVSTENDFGHTKDTLGFDSISQDLYFGGVALSHVPNMHTVHTVPGIPVTYMENSTFNRTELPNPYAVETAKQAVETAKETLRNNEQLKAQAEQTLKTANQAVTEAETALQTANSNLKSQEAQLKDTVALKQTLQSATTTHNQAVVALSNANALVATLSATKADKEAKLAELKATVNQAEKEFNQAKAETKAEKATLSSLQAKAEEATQAVSVAKEALEAKEKVAKEANKAYATAKASYEAEELKKHPVTDKGIPEVRPALPDYALPTVPVVPTTPRVEVPVVNNNGGVAGQDKAKVDVVAKQKTETKNTKDSQAGNWIESAGRWWYQHEDGSYTTNGWEQIKGIWYYFDNTGWMQTGWVKTGASWYYLNETGSLATGWVKDNGTWYYLKENGKMATGWVKDNDKWYYLDSAGAMKTGWFTVSGKWYYAYSSGALAVNTTTPDGYTVNANGEWV